MVFARGEASEAAAGLWRAMPLGASSTAGTSSAGEGAGAPSRGGARAQAPVARRGGRARRGHAARDGRGAMSRAGSAVEVSTIAGRIQPNLGRGDGPVTRRVGAAATQNRSTILVENETWIGRRGAESRAGLIFYPLKMTRLLGCFVGHDVTDRDGAGGGFRGQRWLWTARPQRSAWRSLSSAYR